MDDATARAKTTGSARTRSSCWRPRASRARSGSRSAKPARRRRSAAAARAALHEVPEVRPRHEGGGRWRASKSTAAPSARASSSTPASSSQLFTKRAEERKVSGGDSSDLASASRLAAARRALPDRRQQPARLLGRSPRRGRPAAEVVRRVAAFCRAAGRAPRRLRRPAPARRHARRRSWGRFRPRARPGSGCGLGDPRARRRAPRATRPDRRHLGQGPVLLRADPRAPAFCAPTSGTPSSARPRNAGLAPGSRRDRREARARGRHRRLAEALRRSARRVGGVKRA